ncbi:Rabphilin-3A [Bagarius yarrelli]|uniref:Rabphilin-3A n=1 Tax=Bagarius yarrelli TaxID=175774 RepID=A0A556V2S1_BAGYA|nr:Rabphilin-3A [Bagarius yarrelli]
MYLFHDEIGPHCLSSSTELASSTDSLEDVDKKHIQGMIRFTLFYDQLHSWLEVTVLETKGLAAQVSSQCVQNYVHVRVLCVAMEDEEQQFNCVLKEWKTGPVNTSCSPTFGEKFSCTVTKEEMPKVTVRLEVKDCDKHFLGEVRASLKDLNISCPMEMLAELQQPKKRWKAWVHHYTHHLISRGASLLTLKASFDLGDQCNKWGELLSHLLENVHCRDLSHLDLNWTFTLLEPLDLRVHSGSSSHQDVITKMDQVNNFHILLAKLAQNCPRITKMRLHFDWSDKSVALITHFQHLRILELKYFWVFKGVSPSTLQTLTKSLPNLKSLILNVLVPLRNLGISYTLESLSLEFLDVSLSRGLVFSCLRLPALRELRAKKIVRGITLDRRTRLQIQSRWPCLYQVLREGTPKLQVLNNERLLPNWKEQTYDELTSILQQSCYCLQHLDNWIW